MRAATPDTVGHIQLDGVGLSYEVFGDGEPSVLLLPTWTIVHSRLWKLQVPYVARHFRVITYDAPGNGGADRSLDPAHYRAEAQAEYAEAVLDATGTRRAVLVSLSAGAVWSLCLAAYRPERVLGQVFIGPTIPLTPQSPDRARIPELFEQELDEYTGWELYNAHAWRRDYRRFAEFFFGECFPEPHSTKQREDCVGWATETTPDVLIAEARCDDVTPECVAAWCERVASPVLAIHGDADRISPISRSLALAAATGGRVEILGGSGHIPLAREPVRVNLLLRRFVESLR